MSEWNALFKTTIALLAIVNPVGGVPLFISASAQWAPGQRLRSARAIALAVFLVLVGAALVGTTVLEVMGIGLPSFLVGGGILILMLSVSMMQARESGIRQTPAEAQLAAEQAGLGVVPLAIPLLAGPGAISTMIIAAHAAPHYWYRWKLLLPAGIVALLVWVTLRLAVGVAARLGTVGINIMTRLMGLLLAALAVEFIVRGLGELFPRLT